MSFSPILFILYGKTSPLTTSTSSQLPHPSITSSCLSSVNHPPHLSINLIDHLVISNHFISQQPHQSSTSSVKHLISQTPHQSNTSLDSHHISQAPHQSNSYQAATITSVKRLIRQPPHQASTSSVKLSSGSHHHTSPTPHQPNTSSDSHHISQTHHQSNSHQAATTTSIKHHISQTPL